MYFGYGVDQNEWRGQPIVFHPSPLPTGITTANWQRVVRMGEKWLLQGRFHNSGTSPVNLFLIAYNKAVDSVTITPGVDQLFQLATTPKQLGRALYTIAAIAKKDTLVTEPVPVEVMPLLPIKLLILSSSPDFENKFLKNWLAEKGYEVTARTSISRNKTAKEFLNTTPTDIEQISAALLNRFDVIVADATALNSLSSGELQSIRSAISDKGKGLLVRADSAAQRSVFYTTGFPTVAADTVAQHSVDLRLLNSSITLQPLAASPLLSIRPQPATQPLVTDKENRVLASSALLGSGRIVMSTLPNTFSWMLSGNPDDYTTLWSELITAAAPRLEGEEAWSISPSITRVQEKATLLLETNGTGKPAGQIAGSSIYLSAQEGLPFQYHGMYWPAQPGWQTGIQLNGNGYYWYAYHQEDWRTLKAAQKQHYTQQVSQVTLQPNNATASAEAPKKKAAPKIIFFMIFLLACGYLWFENKYYNS